MGETIRRYRGDTMADEITVTNSAGTPLDITGYVFRLTVDRRRAPTDSATQVFQINGTITDAAGGKVEFVPSLMQATQVPKTYYYDIQMTDGTGRIQTIALGQYIFTQDITK